MLERARERLRELRHAANKRLERETFEPAQPPRHPLPPRPPVEPVPPAAPSAAFPPPALAGLKAAKDALTEPLLQSGQYGALVRALVSVDPTVDQLNNLGCAWAALAVTENRHDYFDRAVDAFERSKRNANKSQQQRAEANAALIEQRR